MTSTTETGSSRPLATKRVLLVEDNFLVGLSIKQQLEELGCDVTGPIASVEDALATVQAVIHDCAVLDINIKGGSSQEVARELRERRTPFFFISGYRSPPMLEQEFREVCRLSKPVEGQGLRDALLMVCGLESRPPRA